MDTDAKDLKQEKDEGKLQALSCSNCGAPLDLDDDGNQQATKKNRIKCKYCGQHHQFTAPTTVPTPGEQQYELNQPVLVKWGQRWWKATVLQVVDTEHWLIGYEGWSDKWDEVVGTDRIAPPPVREKKETNGRWRTWGIAVGIILAVILVVVFVFLNNGSDKDMTPHEPGQTSPGAGATPQEATPQDTGQFTAGDRVDVLWKETWYKAEIKSVEPNGDYNVHYEGYDAEWDERVNPNRVRKRN